MRAFFVVPHVGTWIEMAWSSRRISASNVVPHVGTWIEMPMSVVPAGARGVVPHVGTWIEIAPALPEALMSPSCLT